jgi:hypothetical protein
VAISRLAGTAVAAGLGLSCLFILSFGVLAFRYRVDFYPTIEFGAFLGAALMLERPLLVGRIARAGLLLAAAVSIAASNAELILYRHSDLGTAVDLNVLDYYGQTLKPLLQRF